MLSQIPNNNNDASAQLYNPNYNTSNASIASGSSVSSTRSAVILDIDKLLVSLSRVQLQSTIETCLVKVSLRRKKHIYGPIALSRVNTLRIHEAVLNNNVFEEFRLSHHSQAFDTLKIYVYKKTSGVLSRTKLIGKAKIPVASLVEEALRVSESSSSNGSNNSNSQLPPRLSQTKPPASTRSLNLVDLATVQTDPILTHKIFIRRHHRHEPIGHVDLTFQFHSSVNQIVKEKLLVAEPESFGYEDEVSDESEESDSEASELEEELKKEEFYNLFQELNVEEEETSSSSASSSSTLQSTSPEKPPLPIHLKSTRWPRRQDSGQTQISAISSTSSLPSSADSGYLSQSTRSSLSFNSGETLVRSSTSSASSSSNENPPTSAPKPPPPPTKSSSILSQDIKFGVSELTELASAFFKTGWGMSKLDFARSMLFLGKMYSTIRSDRTHDYLTDEPKLKSIAYFMRYSQTIYGTMFLHAMGHGKTVIDLVRINSDIKVAAKHLRLPRENILLWESSTGVCRPNFFLAYDPHISALVLSIRGTYSLFDTITDGICEYTPFKSGFVHKGIYLSAQSIFDNFITTIKSHISKHKPVAIYLTGHSMGGAVASLLTIMLSDHEPELKNLSTHANFKLHCTTFGSPPVMCAELCDKYESLIDTVINENELFARLSYGSAMDMKAMIREAAGILAMKGVKKAGKMALMMRKREEILASSTYPKLFPPGVIYFLTKLDKSGKEVVVEKSRREYFAELRLKKNFLMDHFPNRVEKRLERAVLFVRKCREEREGNV